MKRFGKKLLKITGYILGSLAILLTAFHFWFIYNAKDMLESMVEKKSNGKLKLKVEKLSYDYFSRTMKIKKAVFLTTDTATAATAYRFDIKEIKIKLTALLPFIIEKKLLIDSMNLQSPDIRVTILRYNPDSVKQDAKNTSIPFQMGKIYKSIQKALQELKVERFQLTNGKFTLTNKASPDQLPVNISNIDFHIDNLKVDSSGNQKILFSENVVLKSYKQDIVFPDGRHLLSFEKFQINLLKKEVEFDSCIISAAKTDSSSASFSVFFDKLLLSNIDFDTLYNNEVIKADTVFCLNPQFTLRADLTKKKDGTAKGPKLEKIIQQLTGDLLLGFVIVKNASFDITTIKNGTPNSFTSHENNFEMQGLSVNQGAERPVKVQGFAMAIRNYENFIEDSSYRVQFDSVLFSNDRIYLSNFLFHKLNNGRIINTFSIPQFYLGGLNWDDLVFEKKLKAQRATLYDPYISYTVTDKFRKKQDYLNIFQSLSAINDYVDLEYLDIVNGKIDLKLKKDLRLQLDKATLSIQSHSLLSSTELASIKKSLNRLDFEKGIIQANGLTIALKNIHYLGQNGRFAAGDITVKDKKKNIIFSAQNVAVEKMIVDEKTGNILAEDINWQKGDIRINAAKSNKENSRFAIGLKKVKGLNTTINSRLGNTTITAKLNSISFSELEKKPGSSLRIEDLVLDGKQLKWEDNNSTLSIGDYRIADNANSVLHQLVYKKNNGKMDADILVPSLTLIPHIQALLNGDIELDAVNLVKPVIGIRLSATNAATGEKTTGFPKMNISEIKLTQPQLNFSQATDSGTLSLKWHGELDPSGFLQITGLRTNTDHSNNISLKTLNLHLSDFIFTTAKGKTFNSNEGEITARLNTISIKQDEAKKWDWSATISDIAGKKVFLDSLGKHKGTLNLDQFTFRDISAGSAFTKIDKLIRESPELSWQHVTGSYRDSVKYINWYNVGFDKATKTFVLDSFLYKPTLDKEAFAASHPFQMDYTSLKTGKMSINGFDADTYLKDSIVVIHSINIADAVVDDFRDKRPPFKSGIIRQLPVGLLKKIPVKLSIDSLSLANATVFYAELNEKTKETGTIPITRMTVRLLHIRNYNLSATDTLRIQANGYLMDSIWTRLWVNQSYTDSLGGFIMTLRMKPNDLSLLNPVLMPLSSVKLQSGFLDTLSMRAAGSEYLAFGEMKMYYHDLKVKFLKNGSETKKSFLTSLITFVAKSFIVKNKNTSRTGRVFFIRMQDRSVFQYLVKIAMSGVASSVGAKSNKKILRKYRRELRQRKLPAFDIE